MIPDVDNIQVLAQKIQASFELPQQMSEVHGITNYYLVPLAPNCLHWKDFLLPPDLRFPCQDLWEEQWRKTMAYAQALQCWAKRANPPIPFQPCLLARSILELCEMMEWYVSFSNDDVLGSVALLEGTPPTPPMFHPKRMPWRKQPPSEVSLKNPPHPRCHMGKWAKIEAPQNWFPSWGKVLHPSQPVTAMGQAPLAFGESKWRHHHWSSGARRAQHQMAEEHLQAEWDSPSPRSPEPT